ncbi:MAG: alpha/beta fold hydrolase, partial [Chloroflexi bacterium]|nr:alpha/beta fold hydrolase [Chloroflexota bacterium]
MSGARGTTADDDSLSGWHVRESGHPDSPSVVLLHGAGLSGAMWAEHMARLAPTFHCLAPDFPGCGLSNRRSWTSVGDAADRVAALIDARVPARRAHIIGISLGGAVAHTLVARHPGLVGRLLIDGAGVLPSWRNLPLLIGIAAISPFLHTRPVIAAMSRSVGRMPAAVQSDLLVASRAAFRRAFAEALGTRAS